MLAVAICRDAGDLYRYLSERTRRTSTEILSYEVSIRTQRLKQHGSLVAHGRLVHPRPTRTGR